MNSRERLLAAMRREPTDYVPLSLDMHPSYRSGPLATAQDQFEVAEVIAGLGADPTMDLWLPIQAPHPEVKITYWREPDPQGEGYLRCKVYETPAGPLRQVVRETADWNSPDHMLFSRTTRGARTARTPDLETLDDYNAPRSREVLIKEEADLDRMAYLFQPLPAPALEQWREEALYAKQEAQRRGLLLHARRTFAGSAVLWLCRPEDFMCRMVDHPAYVERFLRILQDWQNWAVSQALEIGVDMVSRFGLYDGPSYWGERYFARYLAPLLEEESRLVQQGGALHAHGQSDGLTAYTEAFKQLSVPVLIGADEVQGGDDFEVLARELGDRQAFWGGVNSDVTLAGGSEEDLERAVLRALQTLGAAGGLVLWPVWSVYYQVPWGQVEKLVSVWKRHRAAGR